MGIHKIRPKMNGHEETPRRERLFVLYATGLRTKLVVVLLLVRWRRSGVLPVRLLARTPTSRRQILDGRFEEGRLRQLGRLRRAPDRRRLQHLDPTDGRLDEVLHVRQLGEQERSDAFWQGVLLTKGQFKRVPFEGIAEALQDLHRDVGFTALHFADIFLDSAWPIWRFALGLNRGRGAAVEGRYPNARAVPIGSIPTSGGH